MVEKYKCDYVQRAAGAYGMGQKRSLFKRELYEDKTKIWSSEMEKEYLKEPREIRPLFVVYSINHILGASSYATHWSRSPFNADMWVKMPVLTKLLFIDSYLPTATMTSPSSPPHHPETWLEQRWASDPSWASHIPFPDNWNKTSWNGGRWEPYRREADVWGKCYHHSCGVCMIDPRLKSMNFCHSKP